MSFANAPGMHLQHLVLDPSSTNDEKIGCLGILRTVVKNLADPTKSADPKYRQLRLSNDRVRARLSPCPAALDYMKALGFVVVVAVAGGAGECLRLDRAMAPSDAEASLAELDGAIGMLVPPLPGGAERRRRSSSSVEEERGGGGAAASSALPPGGGGATTATGRVSEKERARALLEKKRQAEALEAKEARRRTSDLIKQGEEKKIVPRPRRNIHVVPLSFFFARPCLAPVRSFNVHFSFPIVSYSDRMSRSTYARRINEDKYVRENDENWTSKQSAACVKSGGGINTFRDRFGEN